jgi:polysaccharide deacetylase family protein (PEP-CTERM system associated)
MSEVIVTIDLEDWFQLIERQFHLTPGRDTRGRLRSQVSRILDLLAKRNASATFFVLGMTAEACPEVVEQVMSYGHEIASHGFGHRRVTTLTPESFDHDVRRSIAILEAITGARPRGYRAPEFSIDASCGWAFDVLLDHGFAYDSSIFPFRGRRYGVADASLTVHRAGAPSGRSIVELPLAVGEVAGRRIPLAGGGYWRLLPQVAVDRAVDSLVRREAPMLYFHPGEFDERPLNPPVESLGVLRMALAQNLGRSSIFTKLDRVLERHRGVGALEFLRSRPHGAIATPPFHHDHAVPAFDGT